MNDWRGPSHDGAVPKTMKECKTCRKTTPHQIRSGQGVTAYLCETCLERAIAFELLRD